jgi:hypothetical protein
MPRRWYERVPLYSGRATANLVLVVNATMIPVVQAGIAIFPGPPTLARLGFLLLLLLAAAGLVAVAGRIWAAWRNIPFAARQEQKERLTLWAKGQSWISFAVTFSVPYGTLFGFAVVQASSQQPFWQDPRIAFVGAASNAGLCLIGTHWMKRDFGRFSF